jgi:predicted ThiF/HesA family dinucleotide-utilizing enzyme
MNEKREENGTGIEKISKMDNVRVDITPNDITRKIIGIQFKDHIGKNKWILEYGRNVFEALYRAVTRFVQEYNHQKKMKDLV